MPYNKRKQKCTQSDGDKGNYVLSYTDKKGKKHSACHTSKKNMQGQIAAIEAEADESEGEALEEIRAFIREALVLDAGAVGSATLEGVDGLKDIDIAEVADAAVASDGAQSVKVQQILAFNEMVYAVAFQGGSSNAWQAIAEKMMTQWDFVAPPQGAGGEEVSTFYDVIKDNVYYSVKAAFKAGVNPMNPAAGPSSSPIKIEAICALIIKRPDITMLGNIGCACNLGKPDNPLIGWGEVTAPISRDAVIQNIKNLIVDKDEQLANKFVDATANKPSDADADVLINEINNFFIKELGRKKGRLDLDYVTKILGAKTNEMIGTIKLVPPDELFSRTMGSGIKDGKRSDGTEVGTKEQRDEFMRRMRSVSRTLSQAEMDGIIDTAMRMLGVSSEQALQADGFKRLTGPTQDYIIERIAIHNLVKGSLLKEELTGSDKSEIKRMIKKEIEGAANRREIDKALKKSFDTEFKKSLSSKSVVDEIQKEVEKSMGSSANREVVVRICKDVLVKLYRELSFSYKPVIDRMKV
jgi:hypothetical protein